MANITIELTSEASLISIPYNLPDMSLSSIFANDVSVIDGIIGEGAGATLLPTGVWVGSLTEIDPAASYWFKLKPDVAFPYILDIDVGNIDSNFIGYDYPYTYFAAPGSGAPNYSSFPIYRDDNPVSLSSIDSLCDHIDGITGQGKGAQCVNGSWIGSLTEFESADGYIIKWTSFPSTYPDETLVDSSQFNWNKYFNIPSSAEVVLTTLPPDHTYHETETGLCQSIHTDHGGINESSTGGVMYFNDASQTWIGFDGDNFSTQADREFQSNSSLANSRRAICNDGLIQTYYCHSSEALSVDYVGSGGNTYDGNHFINASNIPGCEDCIWVDREQGGYECFPFHGLPNGKAKYGISASDICSGNDGSQSGANTGGYDMCRAISEGTHLLFTAFGFQYESELEAAQDFCDWNNPHPSSTNFSSNVWWGIYGNCRLQSSLPSLTTDGFNCCELSGRLTNDVPDPYGYLFNNHTLIERAICETLPSCRLGGEAENGTFFCIPMESHREVATWEDMYGTLDEPWNTESCNYNQTSPQDTNNQGPWFLGRFSDWGNDSGGYRQIRCENAWNSNYVDNWDSDTNSKYENCGQVRVNSESWEWYDADFFGTHICGNEGADPTTCLQMPWNQYFSLFRSIDACQEVGNNYATANYLNFIDCVEFFDINGVPTFFSETSFPSIADLISYLPLVNMTPPEATAIDLFTDTNSGSFTFTPQCTATQMATEAEMIYEVLIPAHGDAAVFMEFLYGDVTPSGEHIGPTVFTYTPDISMNAWYAIDYLDVATETFTFTCFDGLNLTEGNININIQNLQANQSCDNWGCDTWPGSGHNDGQTCGCDDLCEQEGDCCDDFCAECESYNPEYCETNDYPPELSPIGNQTLAEDSFIEIGLYVTDPDACGGVCEGFGSLNGNSALQAQCDALTDDGCWQIYTFATGALTCQCVLEGDITYTVQNLSETQNIDSFIIEDGNGHTLTLSVGIGWYGTETFLVTVNDGVHTVEEAFEVEVTDVNMAPYWAIDIADRNMDEGDSQGFTLTTYVDDGGDGDILDLNYTCSSDASPDLLCVIGGEFNNFINITTAQDWFGSGIITVGVTDNVNPPAYQTFAVTVLNINDVPILSQPLPVSFSEDNPNAPYEHLITAIDYDGDYLTYTCTSNNANIFCDISGQDGSGTAPVLLTASPNYHGEGTMTVTVDDGIATDTKTFLVTVNSLNDLPVILDTYQSDEFNEYTESDPATITTLLNISLECSDDDGDGFNNMQYQIVDVNGTPISDLILPNTTEVVTVPNMFSTLSGLLTVDTTGSGGEFAFVSLTQVPNMVGTGTFYWRCYDGIAYSTSIGQVDINIVDIDSPPETLVPLTTNPIPIEIATGESLTGNLICIDDNMGLGYTPRISISPGWNVAGNPNPYSANDGTYPYLPAPYTNSSVNGYEPLPLDSSIFINGIALPNVYVWCDIWSDTSSAEGGGPYCSDWNYLFKYFASSGADETAITNAGGIVVATLDIDSDGDDDVNDLGTISRAYPFTLTLNENAIGNERIQFSYQCEDSNGNWSDGKVLTYDVVVGDNPPVFNDVLFIGSAASDVPENPYSGPDPTLDEGTTKYFWVKVVDVDMDFPPSGPYLSMLLTTTDTSSTLATAEIDGGLVQDAKNEGEPTHFYQKIKLIAASNLGSTLTDPQIHVEVTDSRGNIATETYTINVREVNNPPYDLVQTNPIIVSEKQSGVRVWDGPSYLTSYTGDGDGALSLQHYALQDGGATPDDLDNLSSDLQVFYWDGTSIHNYKDDIGTNGNIVFSRYQDTDDCGESSCADDSPLLYSYQFWISSNNNNVLTDTSEGTITLRVCDSSVVPNSQTCSGLNEFDGLDGCCNQPFDIEVFTSAANDPPYAEDLTYDINENEMLYDGILSGGSEYTNNNITPYLFCTDIDGDTNLLYSIVGTTAESSSTVSIPTSNEGLFFYVPPPNFVGTDSFQYRCYDGELYSNTATVTINLANVNNVPETEDTAESTDEDTSTSISLSCLDWDLDELQLQQTLDDITFSIENDNNLHGSLVSGDKINAGNGIVVQQYTYTPTADFNGNAYFTWKCNDTIADSNISTVTINVTSSNDPPTTDALNFNVNEDETHTVDLSNYCSDVEGDTLNYSIKYTGGAHTGNGGLITLGGETYTEEMINADFWLTGFSGALTYLASDDYFGSDSIQWKCHDGTSFANPEYRTITITVNSVNDRPRLDTIDHIDFDEDNVYQWTVTATQQYGEDDDLTFGCTVSPLSTGNVTCDVVNGSDDSAVFKITPTTGWSGGANIVASVSDGSLTDTLPFSVTVSPVNDPPLLTLIGNQSFNEGGTLSISLSASDEEGGTLIYTCESHLPANYEGHMACEGYIPCSEWSFLYSFYESGDDDYCTINGTIDDCMWSGESCVVDQGTGHPCSVWGCPTGDNDFGNEFCSETLVTDTSPILCDIDGSTLTLSSLTDWNGDGTVTVTVTDDGTPSESHSEEFTVTVNPVNEPPGDIALLARDIFTEPDTRVTVVDGTDGDGAPDSSFDPLVDPRTIDGLIEDGGSYYLLIIKPGGLNTDTTTNQWGWDDIDTEDDWSGLSVSVSSTDTTLLTATYNQVDWVEGDEVCVDYTLADGTAWHDAYADGTHDCEWYRNVGTDDLMDRCNEWGNGSAFEGMTANDACCSGEAIGIDAVEGITATCSGGIATQLGWPYITLKPLPDQYGTTDITISILDSGDGAAAALTTDYIYSVNVDSVADKPVLFGSPFSPAGTSQIEQTISDSDVGCEGLDDIIDFRIQYNGIGSLSISNVLHSGADSDIQGYVHMGAGISADNPSTGFNYKNYIDFVYLPNEFFHGNEKIFYECTSEILTCAGHDDIEFQYYNTTTTEWTSTDEGGTMVGTDACSVDISTVTGVTNDAFNRRALCVGTNEGSVYSKYVVMRQDNVYLYNTWDEACLAESYTSGGEIQLTVNYEEVDLDFGYRDESSITIEQSLSDPHDPLSGMSIMTGSLQNTRNSFEVMDFDKRPSLGMFYYDDDNPLREEFISNLSSPFIQIIQSNLLNNGDGRFVEEHEYDPRGYFLGTDSEYSMISGSTSYKPVGWRNTTARIYYPVATNYTGPESMLVGYPTPGASWGNFDGGKLTSVAIPGNSAHWRKSSDCYSYGKCMDINNNHWGYMAGQKIQVLTKKEMKQANIKPFSSIKVSYYQKTIDLWPGNPDSSIAHQRPPLPLSASRIDAAISNHSTRGYSTGTTNSPQLTDFREEPVGNYPTDCPSNYSICLDGVGEMFYTDVEAGVYDDFYLSIKPGEGGLLHRTSTLSTTDDFHWHGNTVPGNITGSNNSTGEPDEYGSIGSFANTQINKWEKMEFVFNINADWLDTSSNIYGFDLLVYPHHARNTIINNKDDMNLYRSGHFLLDNFSVTEAYDFTPDVDVRMKKGENEYGTGLLTEYYDPNIDEQLEKYNDTTAPLEAAFYFYPRYSTNDIFSEDVPITYNDFRNGMYYIYDVDWGDGSPNEFISEPEKLGDNVMVYHTYEISGIYEVTGTMLRMKPDRDYNPLGVAFNQRFTLRININEGLDEDFKYFGSDGFSFIPYKNTLPVIGGYGKESIYYKSIKRQLGFISDDINVNTQFEKVSDKLKTEGALQKMDSNFDFNTLIEFQKPRYSTSPDYTYLPLELDAFSGNITNFNSNTNAQGWYIERNNQNSLTIHDSFTPKVFEDGTYGVNVRWEIERPEDTSGVPDWTAVNGWLFTGFNARHLEDLLTPCEHDGTSCTGGTEFIWKGDIRFNEISDNGPYLSLRTANETNEYMNTTLNQWRCVTDSTAVPTNTYCNSTDSCSGGVSCCETGETCTELPPLAYGGGGTRKRWYRSDQETNISDGSPWESFEYTRILVSDYATYTTAWAGGSGHLTYPKYPGFEFILESFMTYVTDTDTNPVVIDFDLRNLVLTTQEKYDDYQESLDDGDEVYTGTLYGGIKEELGDSIGDVDMTNIRYFNEPKQMYEMLGLEDSMTTPTGEEFQKWKVDYYQHTESLTYTLDTLPTAGSPTLSTTADWSVYQVGSNATGRFDDVHLLFDDTSLMDMDESSPPKLFTVHYSTWIYVNESFTVDTGLTSDNNGYFYINEDEVASDIYDSSSTADPYTYNFIGGNWYKLDLVLNESGGGDYITMGWNINTTSEINAAAFQSQTSPGNPSSPRYWKNIIPEGTSYMDRNGITIDDNGIYDIDTNVEQTWISGHYYPVLPNYNKFGLFNYDYVLDSYDYTGNHIPFPVEGPITDEELNDGSLKINITSNQIESNILDDLSGNQNYGFAFSDYRPNFDNQTLEPKKVKNTDRIRSSKNDGAF